MSEYGPALFIKRKDGKPLDEQEQTELLAQVVEHAKQLQLKDEDDNAVELTVYGYDDIEPLSLGVLLFASFTYGMMDEEIRQDVEADDKRRILKIGKRIEKDQPGAYAFDSYYVEV